MPTVCEIINELKKKGVKGYSGKTKQQMMNMLEGKEAGEKAPSKKKGSKPKPKPKKEELQKLLTVKDEDDDIYKDKSYIYLKKLADKLKALADNEGATDAESKKAKSKLAKVIQARDKAKEKQYSGKKKK